jgi:hypothetical protein
MVALNFMAFANDVTLPIPTWQEVALLENFGSR